MRHLVSIGIDFACDKFGHIVGKEPLQILVGIFLRQQKRLAEVPCVETGEVEVCSAAVGSSGGECDPFPVGAPAVIAVRG